MQMMHEIIEFQVEQSSQISKHVSFDVWSETGRALLCVSLPHLGFIVFEQPFGARSAGVIRHVENHHALFLPANEGTIRHSLHHGQEVLVAMVTCGHHGEGGPVVLFQHLKYDLELQRGGAGELEVDGAAFLNMNTSHREQGMNSFYCTVGKTTVFIQWEETGHCAAVNYSVLTASRSLWWQYELCSLSLNHLRWGMSQNEDYLFSIDHSFHINHTEPCFH